VPYFEKNLAILARKQPDLAQALRECPDERTKVLPARSGSPTLSYQAPGSEAVLLHSKYDPVREARQFADGVELGDADYLVLLGFGLGYGLEALTERVKGDSARVFIVESDLQILQAAFVARDLSSLLSKPAIHFAWPPIGEALASQWDDFFDPVAAKGNAFIRHPPSLVIDPDFFKAVIENIQSKTFQIFTDINTLVAMAQSFLDNFVANLPLALPAPGVSVLKGQFPQIPAIIVSAGPSLDKNIQDLRMAGDRALILASDTVIKPLLTAGVQPHFVLSGDPSYVNYLHLQNAPVEKTYLVADSTAYHKTLETFEDRILICTFEDSSIHGLSSLLSSKGVLRAWGSVATMCLDFALHLGCNPIIFIGQDLAHSDGRTYCAGLHWEEKQFCGVQHPDEWTDRWQRTRAAKKTIPTEDIFGQPAESTDKLMAYWNWFAGELEKHPDTRFINATEGGVLRENVDIMSLSETLHRYCVRSLDLSARIEEKVRDAADKPTEPDRAIISRLKRESADLKPPLKRGVRLCRNGSSAGERELERELERVRESVYNKKNLAPLLDSFNQMGNYQFLRRRSALAEAAGEVKISDIKETYLDFFQSVQKASAIIDDALIQIRRIIE